MTNNHHSENKEIKLNLINEGYDVEDGSKNETNIPRQKNLPMFQGINVKYDEGPAEIEGGSSCSKIVTSRKHLEKSNADVSMKRFENFSSVWQDDTLADEIQFGNTDLMHDSDAYKRESFSFKKSSKLLSEPEKKNKVEPGKNFRFLSDIKRRTALEEKWSSIEKKKNLIREALKNTSQKPETQRNGSKITLFDDESSEGDTFEPNFEIKSYLDGDSGLKRLNLKAKLACDERFQIDERFFDVNENATKNIDVLKNNQSTLGTIRRYDPSKSVLPPSQSLSTQSEQKVKKMKARSNELRMKPREQTQTAKPEISKEKFYSVSDNLKDVFKKTDAENSFSLSALFNVQLQQNERGDCTDEKSNLMTSAKEFKYIETSLENRFVPDDEGVDEENEIPPDVLLPAVPSEKVLGKCGVWGETFFFKLDDSRLKASFYQSSEPDQNKDFVRRRKQLRSIVKKRIQNSRRDKKIFKRKLGGKLNRTKFKMRLKKIKLNH